MNGLLIIIILVRRRMAAPSRPGAPSASPARGNAGLRRGRRRDHHCRRPSWDGAEIDDQTARVEVAPGVVVTLDRRAIAAVATEIEVEPGEDEHDGPPLNRRGTPLTYRERVLPALESASCRPDCPRPRRRGLPDRAGVATSPRCRPLSCWRARRGLARERIEHMRAAFGDTRRRHRAVGTARRWRRRRDATGVRCRSAMSRRAGDPPRPVCRRRR